MKVGRWDARTSFFRLVLHESVLQNYRDFSVPSVPFTPLSEEKLVGRSPKKEGTLGRKLCLAASRRPPFSEFSARVRRFSRAPGTYLQGLFWPRGVPMRRLTLLAVLVLAPIPGCPPKETKTHVDQRR